MNSFIWDQRRCWGYLLTCMLFLCCCRAHLTLFYLKLWKNLMSCDFPSGKHETSIKNTCANEKFVRIMLLWQHFMGLSKLGTWLIVIFFMPPCNSRCGGNTPCHSDVQLRVVISYHPVPFCGVEHGSLSGWSLSLTA